MACRKTNNYYIMMKKEKMRDAWHYSKEKLGDVGYVAAAFLLVFLGAWGLGELFPNVFFFWFTMFSAAFFMPFVVLFFLCRFLYFYIRGYFKNSEVKKAP